MKTVIPAQAGIQETMPNRGPFLDPGLRRGDRTAVFRLNLKTAVEDAEQSCKSL
jgi:hypothetical protein